MFFLIVFYTSTPTLVGPFPTREAAVAGIPANTSPCDAKVFVTEALPVRSL